MWSFVHIGALRFSPMQRVNNVTVKATTTSWPILVEIAEPPTGWRKRLPPTTFVWDAPFPRWALSPAPNIIRMITYIACLFDNNRANRSLKPWPQFARDNAIVSGLTCSRLITKLGWITLPGPSRDIGTSPTWLILTLATNDTTQNNTGLRQH